MSAVTPEDLHAHVESCLRRSGGVLSGLLQGSGEDEVVDVEGDGPYEEYEWCGQRRVRVSSLLRPQPQLLDRHREGGGGGERSGDSEMTSGAGGVGWSQ